MPIDNKRPEEELLPEEEVHVYKSYHAKAAWPVRLVGLEHAYGVSALGSIKTGKHNVLCVKRLTTLITSLKSDKRFGQIVLVPLDLGNMLVVTYFDGKIFLRPGFCIDRPAQTLDESHLRANLNFELLFVNVAKKL